MRATGNFDKVKNVDPLVELTAETRKHIDHWVAKFPEGRQRSALIQALHATQEQNGGYLTDVLIASVAKYLDLPPLWAYEVASFYSLFALEPVGRHEVAVCTNISCWLNGGKDMLAHCQDKLGIKPGESSADGRVYLKDEDECMAACCGAPMMMVDGDYYENLTTEKIDQIIDGLE